MFRSAPTKAQSSKVLEREKREAQALKLQLSQLLKEPLTASGVSMKYLTSGINGVADDLIAGISECYRDTSAESVS